MSHTTADKLARLMPYVDHIPPCRYAGQNRYSPDSAGCSCELQEIWRELQAALREPSELEKRILASEIVKGKVAEERERCAKIMEGSPWNMPDAAAALGLTGAASNDKTHE